MRAVLHIPLSRVTFPFVAPKFSVKSADGAPTADRTAAETQHPNKTFPNFMSSIIDESAHDGNPKELGRGKPLAADGLWYNSFQ